VNVHTSFYYTQQEHGGKGRKYWHSSILKIHREVYILFSCNDTSKRNNSDIFDIFDILHTIKIHMGILYTLRKATKIRWIDSFSPLFFVLIRCRRKKSGENESIHLIFVAFLNVYKIPMCIFIVCKMSNMSNMSLLFRFEVSLQEKSMYTSLCIFNILECQYFLPFPPCSCCV
jgi:hypothetical protein